MGNKKIKMAITKDQQRLYFESLGNKCPFCFSIKIDMALLDFQVVNTQGDIEWAQCGKCNRLWSDLRKQFKRHRIPDDTGFLGHFSGKNGKPYVFIGLDRKAVFVDELKIRNREENKWEKN